VARDCLITIKLLNKLFKVSCYEFMKKIIRSISVVPSSYRRYKMIPINLFLIICTIFENVWHHKHPSVFHVTRVFIALRPMGFRPLDHLAQDTGLSTGHAPHHSQCEISISGRMDLLQCLALLDTVDLH